MNRILHNAFLFVVVLSFALAFLGSFAPSSAHAALSCNAWQSSSVPAQGTAIGTTFFVGVFNSTQTNCQSWCESQSPTSNNACVFSTPSIQTTGTCSFFQGTTELIDITQAYADGEPACMLLACTGTRTSSSLCAYTPDGVVPTVTLTAVPGTITAGQSSVLTWDSENAESCTGTNFSTSGAVEGSVSKSPTVTTTYSVSCTGGGQCTTVRSGEDRGADEGKGTSVRREVECTGSTTVTASATVTVTQPSPACSDGTDNDGDGKADYPTDPGCSSPTDDDETDQTPPPAGECSDGIDNDGDGLVDFPADQGCTSGSGGSETSQCQDGIDNNGNGKIDLADGACSGANDNNEFDAPQCSDGIDNNGNGAVDYPDDTACTSPEDNLEEANPDALISLLAAPALARLNDSIDLVWSATNATECTLAGTNGDSWILIGSSGTETTSGLQSETTYTLSCVDLEGETVSVSATIKITPSFQETLKRVPQLLATALLSWF